MIPKADAVRQCNRLAAFPKWLEIEKEGKAEIRDTLQRVAATPEHAKKIIDRWMARAKFLPAPADIIALADETQPEPHRADHTCPHCGGMGFSTADYLVTREFTPSGGTIRREVQALNPAVAAELRGKVDNLKQMVAGASGYCSCAYGAHLKAAKAAHDAQETR